MRLRDVIAAAGPWSMLQDPYAMAGCIEREWGGARVFMTRKACKRRWVRESRAPRGAAEHVAARIEEVVIAAGGTPAHVERILVGCMGERIHI